MKNGKGQLISSNMVWRGKEIRNIMTNGNNRCKQLRKLHTRLVEEIKILKEDIQEERNEGVANPVVTINILKGLQETLGTVELELQKCPPESES